MKRKIILPPTFLLISIMIMVLLHFALPLTIVISRPWNLPGILVLILGMLLDIYADQVFRHAGTTVMPFNESTVLVTNGLYRISRNPMYLGFVLILAGLAVLMGTLTPFIIIPIFLITIDLRFISTEEEMLSKRFGKVYREYKTGTRRWI